MVSKTLKDFPNYTLRWSHSDDMIAVKELLYICFGERPTALKNIEGRYLLLFDKKNLIAMTGIDKSESYNGLEIDWSCVHPDYRRRGIMTALFQEMINNTKADIYCSCWRKVDKPINLRKQMSEFGFVPVLIPRVQYDSRYFCTCDAKGCNGGFSPDSDGVCHCYEDLYVRKYEK